jgi:hypothetical protein
MYEKLQVRLQKDILSLTSLDFYLIIINQFVDPNTIKQNKDRHGLDDNMKIILSTCIFKRHFSYSTSHYYKGDISFCRSGPLRKRTSRIYAHSLSVSRLGRDIIPHLVETHKVIKNIKND